ncbi:MAG: 50S ribosomal protein L34e [Candidatus Nanoarchaeia archaeon]|nr:50S ribosomal protein L34e [Candidatus Nanoarchaeia archaeon]
MAKTRSERTSKKRAYTSPGGDSRIEYHKRKNAKILCGNCKEELMGVPRRMKKKSKTQKAPNRPYAGNFCSSCSRKLIKEKILNEYGVDDKK